MELLRGTSLVNLRINEENREDIHGIQTLLKKDSHMLRLLLKPIQTIMVIA